MRWVQQPTAAPNGQHLTLDSAHRRKRHGSKSCRRRAFSRSYDFWINPTTLKPRFIWILFAILWGLMSLSGSIRTCAGCCFRLWKNFVGFPSAHLRQALPRRLDVCEARWAVFSSPPVDPGWLFYIGDFYTSQLYRDYFINHEFRIPIKQPMSLAGFACCSGKCFESCTGQSWFATPDVWTCGFFWWVLKQTWYLLQFWPGTFPPKSPAAIHRCLTKHQPGMYKAL